MQIKVTKYNYSAFFQRKIWSCRKKVVILQAFLREVRNTGISEYRNPEEV